MILFQSACNIRTENEKDDHTIKYSFCQLSTFVDTIALCTLEKKSIVKIILQLKVKKEMEKNQERINTKLLYTIP